MNYEENYKLDTNEPIEETNKPKVFTIINYVITVLLGIFFLFVLYIGISGIYEHLTYTPDPDATVNVDTTGLILVLYIVYGGISAGCDLVGVIISAINLKFDKKNALINLFINLGYIVLTILLFVIMIVMINGN